MSPLQFAILKARYARPPEPVPEPMKIEIADPQADRIKRLEEVLRKAAIEHPLPPPPSPVKCEYPSVKSIIEAVAEEYGVLVTDILSHRRHVSVTFPRHVAMYLCKVLTICSFPEIGRKFGGRDHTTALAANRKIKAILEYSEALRIRIDSLAEKIRNAQAVEQIEQTIAAKYPGVA